MKNGYEPLTTKPLVDVEDASTYAKTEEQPCTLRCKLARCRPCMRIMAALAFAAVIILHILPMFGPPRHHHGPWGPHPHGGDPFRPHGPGGIDEAHGAAMSMAAFEVEAAMGPAVRDPGNIFAVVKGPEADDVSSIDWHKLHSFIVVVLGKNAPERRTPDQPFLSTEPQNLLPLDAINNAAAAYENSVGRTLFPIKIQLADMAALTGKQDIPGKMPCKQVRPYVVYDVAKGLVMVDAQLLDGLQKVQQIQSVVTAATGEFLEQITTMLSKHMGHVDPHMIMELASTASGVAVAAAFASAVPLWFCIACPAVLGLALPLAINLGLGEIVNLICEHFQFSGEQCMDLGVAALAVGFVLALASALPIFKVCKMYECEHQPKPPASQMP